MVCQGLEKSYEESDINGWFLDKPIGISSNRALQQEKNFHYCKAGYVGTLIHWRLVFFQ